MLLDLFLCFVQVGLFSIGGGYAAMPMIQAKAVEHYHWLTMGEFTDLMTIAEMTPGPITVNSATFVGIRMAGIPGALVATMGCILPSLIIVSLLSWLYEKYRSMDAMQAVLACLRPAVVALIASAALTILRVVVFAGGVVGLLLYAWLLRSGTPLIASSPLLAFIAVVGFCTTFGLLAGGLVTMRPDHVGLITEVREALEQGRWAVVVHPTDTAQTRQARALLQDGGGAQVARTL